MARKRSKQPATPKEPDFFTKEWIIWLRTEHLHIPQYKAARLIGVSQPWWNQWENGERLPDESRWRFLWVLAGRKLEHFPEKSTD